jgi:hypothetical protein
MGKFLADNKQIIAAVVAGLFAITAAYIRRDKTGEKAGGKTPVLALLCFPFLYLILGLGMLAAEFFSPQFQMVEELGHRNLSNPGEILSLAGCVFVVAGVLWLPINITRLMFWPKPKLASASVAVGKSAGADSVSLPPGSSRDGAVRDAKAVPRRNV